MLEVEELERLAQEIELDFVERKSSPADLEKIKEAVCAYANDLPNRRRPGVIFIGINDDGSCANLPITDDLLLNLASIRDSGQIYPIPTITVSKEIIGGCTLAVIAVRPSDSPPVKLRGRTRIRVGPRRAEATDEEEQLLRERRRAGNAPFDARTAPKESIDGFDLDLIKQVYMDRVRDDLDTLGLSDEDFAKSLRIVDSNGHPTYLGLMIGHPNVHHYIPGFYIQFVRYEGDEITDAIKNQSEIAGSITDIMGGIDTIIKNNISSVLQIGDASTDVRIPDYPIKAIRQAIANAVMHRSYDMSNSPIRLNWFNNRMEISNPGPLFGQVTPENFGAPGLTDYRNPHLAHVMKEMGYVQRFGAGIKIMHDELERNGNPRPEFSVDTNHILVTIRSAGQ